MEILEFIDHELSVDTQMRIAETDHKLVPKLINPHPDVIKIMVSKSPYLFKKIKNPTKEMRYAAAEANMESIYTMGELTDDEKLHFFDMHGFQVVGLLKNPPRIIQEKVIATGKVIYINSLQHIDTDLQMNMVKENPWSVVWIVFPALETVDYALSKRADLLNVLWKEIKDIYPIELFSKDTIDNLLGKNIIKETKNGYELIKRNSSAVF